MNGRTVTGYPQAPRFAVLAVACPHCGAGQQEKCVSRTGKPHMDAHSARYAMAKRAGVFNEPDDSAVTAEVTAEQYGEICDAIERTYHGWPLTDDTGFLHTSKEARAAAMRIIEILGLEIQDPREISR